MNNVDNKDRYFKGQQKNEEFICFFRNHWIYLLKEIVLFAIFLSLLTFVVLQIDTIKEILRGNRELKIVFYIGFLITTIYMHRFFIKILNYFVNIGIITNIRVIDHNKTIFFKDTIDSIDMAQIQNIEMKAEGVLPSLLNYGDIKIYLTASDTIKTFEGVPNAKFHFRCLNRQKEARQMALLRDRGHLPPNLQQTVKVPKTEFIQIPSEIT